MSKHTPGPWIKPEGSMGIWKDKNTKIAIVTSKNYTDAHLIAAAPTMYDFIKEYAEAGNKKAIALLDAID